MYFITVPIVIVLKHGESDACPGRHFLCRELSGRVHARRRHRLRRQQQQEAAATAAAATTTTTTNCGTGSSLING